MRRGFFHCWSRLICERDVRVVFTLIGIKLNNNQLERSIRWHGKNNNAASIFSFVSSCWFSRRLFVMGKICTFVCIVCIDTPIARARCHDHKVKFFCVRLVKQFNTDSIVMIKLIYDVYTTCNFAAERRNLRKEKKEESLKSTRLSIIILKLLREFTFSKSCLEIYDFFCNLNKV